MTAQHEHANAYACTCGYGLGTYTGSAEARYEEVVASLRGGAR